MHIRQRLIVTLLFLLGTWMVTMVVYPASKEIATAQSGIQQYPPPEDRPPLRSSPDRNPTSTNPEPEPTSPSEPLPPNQPPLRRTSGSGKSRGYTTPIPAARITGTIIDQYTGKPASGIFVRVGSEVVVSDEYGNYERNELAAGVYSIELLLDSGQGVMLQQPELVTVVGSTTIERHLFYTSDPSALNTIGATEPLTLPLPIEVRALPAVPTEPAAVPLPTPTSEEVPVILGE